MQNHSRRRFLIMAVAAQATASLTACGGGVSEAQAATETALSQAKPDIPNTGTAPVAPEWRLHDTLYLVANGVSAFDLNQTLPPSVPRGGAFRIDPAGAALPIGLTLTTGGMLTASASAVSGDVTGVVFVYETL